MSIKILACALIAAAGIIAYSKRQDKLATEKHEREMDAASDVLNNTPDLLGQWCFDLKDGNTLIRYYHDDGKSIDAIYDKDTIGDTIDLFKLFDARLKVTE